MGHFAAARLAIGAAAFLAWAAGLAQTGACPVDTTQADFQFGTPTNVDLTTSPGNVALVNAPAIDQQNTTLGTSGVGITVTTWGGQTFTPSVNGRLSKVDINLFCSGCTGTTPNLTLGLRATSGGLPTGADIASATVTGFNSGAAVFYTATFATPPALTSGTQYALVIRPTANPAPGTYALTRSGTATAGANVYAGGTRVAGATSGSVWSIPLTGGVNTDAGFKVYMDTGFATSGSYVSSVKDSSPPPGFTPTWSTLSWSAVIPTGTMLSFQVAGSNSSAGPFNFVGPDGSAATFFTTTGAALSRFDGNRYLAYKAFLSTTDAAATPTLSDVTACYSLLAPPDLSISNSDGLTAAVAGGSVTYSITASNIAGATGVVGATVTDSFPPLLACSWTCAGSGGGTCTAASSGNINDVVDLPSGSSITYAANCAVSAGASGAISNTASITPPAGVTESDAGNNSATDTDTLIAQANLAIANSDGTTTATPGGSLTYIVSAFNAGPSNAASATVTDTFPASLACTWTCVGTSGGTCTSAGSGNIGDTVSLPSGGSVIYTAHCAISSSASGTISNTASIAPLSGVIDPSPGNNTATDTDTLSAQANLAITNSDGVTTATPGGSLIYSISASNAGPSSAAGATVTDTFPSTLSCVWTCVGAAGGACTATGSGNIGDTVDLPSGGSVVYTASCTVAASASGSIANTASVTPPAGVIDPNPANNAASDNDAVSVVGASVSGTLSVAGTFTVGGTVTYTATLTNAGPGPQNDNPGNEFTDVLPAELALVSATSMTTANASTAANKRASPLVAASNGTVTANTATNTVTWNGAIPAGGSVTIIINATALAAASGKTLSNQASIAFDGDGDGVNESVAMTDDPGGAGLSDATTFQIAQAAPPNAAAEPVPTLSSSAIACLVLALAAAGLMLPRRDGARR